MLFDARAGRADHQAEQAEGAHDRGRRCHPAYARSYEYEYEYSLPYQQQLRQQAGGGGGGGGGGRCMSLRLVLYMPYS